MLRINQLIGFGVGENPLQITKLGSGTSTSSDSTVTLTTSVAVAAGETIVVIVGRNNDRAVSSVGDGTANTYTQADTGNAAGADIDIFHCLNPVAVSASSTITVTFGANCDSKCVTAFKIGKTCTQSLHGNANGSSTTPSVSTSGSIGGNEAVFGGCCVTGSAVVLTQPGAPWGDDTNTATGTAATRRVHSAAHYVTSGAGTATYNPTLDISSVWAAAIAAYK